MRIRIASIITSTLFAFSCATTVGPASGWNDIVYPGFDKEVVHLSASNAIDCGYFDLSFQSQKLRNDTLEKQFNCVIAAKSEGKSFKAGYTWVPSDSKLTKVFISHSSGVYIKTVDVLLDGSGAEMNSQLCGEVHFDIGLLVVDASDCDVLAK